MMRKVQYILFCLVLCQCDKPEHSSDRVNELERTEKAMQLLHKNAQHSELRHVVSIDHSVLAEADGAVLNANEVTLLSNPKLNTMFLKDNIRAGLDLPYRVQAYFADDGYHLRYTPPEFLVARHGVSNPDALALMRDDLEKLSAHLPNMQPIDVAKMDRDYGIVELVSDFDFHMTVTKLKQAVLGEGDTEWFADLDFQLDAKEFGVDLPWAQLLIFGAPAPGAKAMFDYPALGLDAFPQKVFVYEDEDKKVRVLYNDIPAIAEFHYSDSAMVHKHISLRLKSTLSKAIEK